MTQRSYGGYSSDPICPHCGHKDQDWWDGISHELSDQDEVNANCGSCGKDYWYRISITYNFEVSK